jgi:ABC-type transport system involved in cytochrome bd biosynthesis fused ATPase/permease subunit
VLLKVTRLWLPLAIAVAGVVCIVIGHARTSVAAAGVVLLGTALIVWMINWLFQMSIQSNRDRDREEEARQYFDEHGRWPGE